MAYPDIPAPTSRVLSDEFYPGEPLGHGGGPLFNPDMQLSIAREALQVCEGLREPGKIIHLDQAWPEGDIWKTAANDQSADDVRSPRDSIPRYQFEEDRRLAEAAAGD